MIIIVFLLIILALFVYHVCNLGTYYIEFNGETYTVWIRGFMGYDDILNGAYKLASEEKAKECIERSKKNPPRIINL